jgi:hypothetical protein
MSQRSALIFAIAMLAVSGCGSSSKTGSTSTSAQVTPTTTAATTTTPTSTTSPTQVKEVSGAPLTRAEWIAKGDAICAQLNTQLAANVVDKSNGFATVLPQAAAYEHAEVVQLTKLVPPSSQAKDWHMFLAETQRWSENTAKLGASAKSGHFTLSTPLVALTTKIRANVVSIAKREGFKYCSEVK